MNEQQLLLKIERLESKIDHLQDAISQLCADRYPRYVGVKEAGRILGVSRTTMSDRLNSNYYPFAIKENGHWRIPLNELYRFQGQH